jgi:hypothetical protein
MVIPIYKPSYRYAHMITPKPFFAMHSRERRQDEKRFKKQQRLAKDLLLPLINAVSFIHSFTSNTKRETPTLVSTVCISSPPNSNQTQPHY